MPPLLAALLFWSSLLAAILAQVMILRSTRRVLRAVTPRKIFPMLEWAFALAPALALAAVLVLSWFAAMRP